MVGDTVYTTPREGMLATMYVAMAQRKPAEFWSTVLLTVNTAPGTRAMVERDVAEALRRADPMIAFTFGTFDQLVEATVTQERLIALVSAFFGGLALLLAAVGLYGVVAHAVRARQREIGLRIALGAAPSSILRLVFARVGLLIAAGLALGLAGSLWAARFVEALLFQLEPRDPVTFGGAAAVLVAVGVLAAWLPAHRAARLDPVRCCAKGRRSRARPPGVDSRHQHGLVSLSDTMTRHPVPDLLPGTLDLLILRTLQTASLHGWAISERIQQISEDVLQINQGSLYPALHRLEHHGWIKAEWAVSELGRRAKYYQLTPAGRRQLAVEASDWDRMATAIGRVMKLA